MPSESGFSLADTLAGNEDARHWWKETVVRQVLSDSDRDFVWTDDDLERSVRDSIKRDFPQDSLMIRPSINPGLNDKHLDGIRAFLERAHKGDAEGR